MSPETILSVGVSPASTSAAASPPAAALGGGSAAGGTGSGSGCSGDAPGTSSGSSANPEPSAQAGNPQGSSSSQHSGRSKSASAQTRPRSGSQAKHNAPAGKNFSQALAQSFAAPVHGSAQVPAATSAGKAAKPAARPSDKAHKSDPVSTAMAMMSQGMPVAAPSGAAAAKSPASAGAETSGATRINPAGLAAESAAHKLVQTKALTQISGTESHGAQGAAAQISSNAQTLSAAQFAAGVHSAARPQVAAPSAALSAPVGSSGWNEQLGTQLTWMASQGVQNASLQMSPQHLGPVQVSISVHHGQASVWFGAAQPETRQALSQALPQLRAMFASQGLALTDSGVSQDAPRDSRRPARPTVNAVGEVGATQGSSGSVSVGLSGTGLIDTYA